MEMSMVERVGYTPDSGSALTAAEHRIALVYGGNDLDALAAQYEADRAYAFALSPSMDGVG